MQIAIIILFALCAATIVVLKQLKKQTQKIEQELQNSAEDTAEYIKNMLEIMHEHSSNIEYFKENFVEKERTPQIVEWIKDDGFYPIDIFKEEELKKTQEYEEVIKARYPLFVEFYDKSAGGVFDLDSFSKAEKAKEKAELSKFYENQPPWRKKNKDGTVTYCVPRPGEKAYKKYCEAAKKRAPDYILLNKNGDLSPMF